MIIICRYIYIYIYVYVCIYMFIIVHQIVHVMFTNVEASTIPCSREELQTNPLLWAFDMYINMYISFYIG